MSIGVDPVTHRGGNLQIIACAGAGKTETMALRVTDILAGDFYPEGIIAFTFTEKAAGELKARIEKKVSADQRLGPEYLDRLNPMFVGTMHAYCMRMLQQHVPEMAAFDVLDDHRHNALLSRETNRLGLNDLSHESYQKAVTLFRTSVDVVENELLSVEDLGNTEFASVYGEYLTTLANYNALTYGQMIVVAVEILRAAEGIADRVLEPLRHIIVDEYQDTNHAQEALISTLSSRGAEVCVVGDDDQSIYQWRGATVENILTFAERYPDVSTCELPRNRRSQPSIVEMSRDFVETWVSNRLEKSLEPARPDEGGRVIVWEADHPTDEADAIAETIVGLHRENGFRWGEIAILLRSVRTASKPIIEALELQGIPYQCTGSSGLFMEPDAQLFARLYAWLADKDWNEDRWSPDFQPVTIEGLMQAFTADFGLSGDRRKKLERHLVAWKAHAGSDSYAADLVGDFYELLQLLGVQEWEFDANETLPARFGALGRFSNLLADYEHATRRSRWDPDQGAIRGGTQGGEWFYRRLYYFIQFYALGSYEGFAGEETMLFDAVAVSTVHGAKGLQWPIVFLPSLTSKRFPSSNMGRAHKSLISPDLYDKARYEGGIEDEARLFYVAMTRARDGLYVSRFRRLQKQQGPSPFFTALADSIDPIEAPLPLTPRPTTPTTPSAETPIISFSDLADYDSCPHGYRLRSRIGFQPKLVRELGFGKAVHHMLRRIGEETHKDGEVPPSRVIGEIFEQEFYLPFANKPAFKELRQSAERLVAMFVEQHRAELERVWEIERPFELHLTNATVVGRADVILDREDGRPGAMAIVDYKTAVHDDDRIHRLQLQIYTSAGRKEGIDVSAAYLMDLHEAQPRDVEVAQTDIGAAEEWATGAVAAMLDGRFPANPGAACDHCDVNRICSECGIAKGKRG